MLQRQSQQRVQRQVVARRAGLTRAEETRARALATRMDALATAAQSRSAQIGAVSDACIGDVQAANAHLQQVGRNYRQGYGQFMAVLRQGDSDQEFNKAITDAVVSVVVAAALAVVLPEALLTAAAMGVARSLVASTSAGMVRAGIRIATVRAATPAAAGTFANAAVGEVVEMGAGGMAGAAAPAGDRATDSAALAGPNEADKLQQLLDRLGAMIRALPQYGALATSQGQLGLGAAQISADSARLRAGDDLGVTLGDLEQQAVVLDGLNQRAAAVMAEVHTRRSSLAAMKEAALAVELKTKDQYEHQLWMEWIAALTSSDLNELLDLDSISDHLEALGIVDFGAYTSDDDQEAAVVMAQEHWLSVRGIPRIPSWPVREQYRAYKAREDLRNQLVGSSGVMNNDREALVGGTAIETTTQQGHRGQPATVTGVDFAHHMTPTRNSAIYLAVWGADHFRAEVTLGSYRSAMPDLAGLALQEAVDRAWQAGFICDLEYADTAGAPGRVMRTSPAAGTVIETNSPQSGDLAHVQLVVSR